jgi:hypothetical protein
MLSGPNLAEVGSESKRRKITQPDETFGESEQDFIELMTVPIACYVALSQAQTEPTAQS